MREEEEEQKKNHIKSKIQNKKMCAFHFGRHGFIYGAFYCTMHNSFCSVLGVWREFSVCIGHRRCATPNKILCGMSFSQANPFLIASKCILNWIMGNINVATNSTCLGLTVCFARAFQCFIDHLLDLFSSCYCSASRGFFFLFRSHFCVFFFLVFFFFFSYLFLILFFFFGFGVPFTLFSTGPFW